MRWWLVLLILAAAGGAGWLLFYETEHHGEAEGDTERSAPSDAAPKHAVALAGAESGGPRSLRAALGRSSIKVRVTKDGAPAVARVEARQLSTIAGMATWGNNQRWIRDAFQAPTAPGPAAAATTSDADGNGVVAG